LHRDIQGNLGGYRAWRNSASKGLQFQLPAGDAGTVALNHDRGAGAAVLRIA
jgi:hypothetical protein